MELTNGGKAMVLPFYFYDTPTRQVNCATFYKEKVKRNKQRAVGHRRSKEIGVNTAQLGCVASSRTWTRPFRLFGDTRPGSPSSRRSPGRVYSYASVYVRASSLHMSNAAEV